MKKTLFLPLLLFVLFGCDSGVTPSPEKTVHGEWAGVIYEGPVWENSLQIRIEDGFIIGSHRILNTETLYERFSAVTGTLVGNEESFTAHLQIGIDPNNLWVYTGYVEEKELCLVRDLLPEPVRCLYPVN